MRVPESVWVAIITAVVSIIGYHFTMKDHGNENISDERKNLFDKYGEVYNKLDKALDEKAELNNQINKVTNERDRAVSDRDEWQNKYSEAVAQLKKQDTYIRELKDKLKKLGEK